MDSMSEPTVQVPVSLIERIVDGVGPTRTRAFDELRALLSQPPVSLREQVQALRDEMFAECDSEDHLVPLDLLIERLDALLSQPTPPA